MPHHFSYQQCIQLCYKWNSGALECLRSDLNTQSARLFVVHWIANYLESRSGGTEKYYSNVYRLILALLQIHLWNYFLFEIAGKLTLCLPQPDKTTRCVASSCDVGSAIGWMRSVNVISSAVRIKAMSSTSCWRLNPVCGVIVSSSTSTPPSVWRNAPTSAYTFSGLPLSFWQQCAAVNKNRLLKMDAPQKCDLTTFRRRETGNWKYHGE